jgi:flavodoxin
MKKVLIAYYSLSGNTQKMAQYVAEGVRFSGQEATVKKVADIKEVEEVNGYDGYIFASPTYYQDIGGPMKTFLFLARKASLEGKLAGAFGSYTHDGNAPKMIIDTMEYVFKMEPFNLGALNVKDIMLEESGRGDTPQPTVVAGEVHGQPGEGMRACQDYGRVFGETLDKG